jgi:phage terminase large subunit GpA-like protein
MTRGQENVGMKGAQVGFTETVLDIALYNMDIHAKDVLYVLPSKTPDASDFSAARFDTMLELSPYIARMFSNTKNVGHKKAGSVNFYLRGANSRGGLEVGAGRFGGAGRAG